MIDIQQTIDKGRHFNWILTERLEDLIGYCPRYLWWAYMLGEEVEDL